LVNQGGLALSVRKGAIGVVALAALLVTLLVTTSATARPTGSIKAAAVTDIGGLGDKGFNDLCKKGIDNAKVQLGASGRVYISKSAGDYIPNLSSAARGGYQAVVACGFLLGADTLKAAKRFPQTKFATIDYGYGTKGAKNLRGLIFAEQESGYLAGVAAAFASKSNSVSFVGGQAVPAVVKFRAGYIAGAKATKKGIKVAAGYSESFTDQAKCKEMALNQMAAGSDVVFAAAGSCGLGALQAAKEEGNWGVGVDSDQAFLGTHILTSAVKRVDVAVFRTVRDVENGSFKAGDSLFNIKNGGVTFGKISSKFSKAGALRIKLNAVAKQIAAGKIKPPVK
jgi:basic membrane protein A and related proteins